MDSPTGTPEPRIRRLLRRTLLAAAWASAGLAALWCPLAIFFLPWPSWIGGPAALAAALAGPWALLFARPRRRARLGFAGAAAAVVLAWTLVAPSNGRDWQPDVAVPQTAEIQGDRILLRGVRDCRYRSDSDYDVRRSDRTLDLSRLKAADLFVVYWGSPLIAHTMLSFVFEDGDPVCFSIETRKEQGESYSALKGFFKQYELVYIAAEERDLVRVRAAHRGEDVYLYRLRAEPARVRRFLLDYLERLNRLAERPEWYHAVLNNCTNNILGHTLPYAEGSRGDWRLALNGGVDELAYRTGALAASGLPFEDLRRRSRVTARAAELPPDADYSRRLREGLPAISP